ncbi:MAG: glycosyltransferase [Cytophagales bacterium]|nr:glycosyltransferase [Cytophagales bacterium]
MEEVINDSESGLLADAYDAKQMADKLEKFMNDDSFRDRIALEGYEVIQREFTLQRQIKIFMEKYNEALHA